MCLVNHDAQVRRTGLTIFPSDQRLTPRLAPYAWRRATLVSVEIRGRHRPLPRRLVRPSHGRIVALSQLACTHSDAGWRILVARLGLKTRRSQTESRFR